MEPVLTDLELDLREIKYLLDILSREPDSMLQKVAIRRVRQMQSHLGVLLQEIEGITTEEKKIIEKEDKKENVEVILPTESVEEPALSTIEPEPVKQPEPLVEAKPEPVIIQEESVVEITEIHTTQVRSWGDRVKPAADLKSSLTLNDRFLYSRELFQGDMEHMDNVLFQISQMESLDNVLSFLESILHIDEEDETYQSFMERIRKYFD